MKIVEIFETIQGEGRWIGLPQIFIRLFGCNLNCRYCDTPYSRQGKFIEISPAEIIKRISHLPARSICITGGEPLLQLKELRVLLGGLIKQGRRSILIETNGTIYPESLLREKDLPLFFSVAPKFGSSGEKPTIKVLELFAARCSANDLQIKMVVKNDQDVEEAISFLSLLQQKLILKQIPVFFTPESNVGLSTYLPRLRKFHNIFLTKILPQLPGYNLYYLLQQHKILWGQKKEFGCLPDATTIISVY